MDGSSSTKSVLTSDVPSAVVSPDAPRDAPHSATTAPTIAKPALFAAINACTRSTSSDRTLGGSASAAILTPCMTVVSGSTNNASDPTNTIIGNSAITA